MTGSLSHTRGRPEPGRELDALIAEKVMGWSRCMVWNFPWLLVPPDGDGSSVRDVPNFSTDIAAAWLVVEKMRADGWHLSLVVTRSAAAAFGRLQDNEPEHSHALIAPHAICLAALAALSPADDGGAR